MVDGRVFAVYLFGKQNGVKTFDSSVDGEEAEKLYDDISNGLSLTATFNCKTAVQVKAELLKNEFTKVYDPTNPLADENGYVTYSNVDTTEEMIDLMAASNAYQANLTALSVVKSMITKTLELKK